MDYLTLEEVSKVFDEGARGYPEEKPEEEEVTLWFSYVLTNLGLTQVAIERLASDNELLRDRVKKLEAQLEDVSKDGDTNG